MSDSAADLARGLDTLLPRVLPGVRGIAGLSRLSAGTLDRLAIDQPAYPPYRDEIAPEE